VALLGALPARSEVGALPAGDRELAASVREALSRDRKLEPLRLQVSASDGTIRLQGRVPTLGLAREAIRLAAARRGVFAVEDHLELPDSISDRTVGLRIDALLAPYADLRRPGVTLKVAAGKVSGSGQVGTLGRLLFLEEKLMGVSGVREVDLSDLSIEGRLHPTADDETLRDAILALLKNPLVFPVSGRIVVEVRDRRVHLSGEVPRLIDRLEARHVAGLVTGVEAVADEIRINPERGRMRVLQPADLSLTR
jgi:osmotically-inducible protein OsmY